MYYSNCPSDSQEITTHGLKSVLFLVDRVQEKDLYYNFLKLHLTNENGKGDSIRYGASGEKSQVHIPCGPVLSPFPCLPLLFVRCNLRMRIRIFYDKKKSCFEAMCAL